MKAILKPKPVIVIAGPHIFILPLTTDGASIGFQLWNALKCNLFLASDISSFYIGPVHMEKISKLFHLN